MKCSLAAIIVADLGALTDTRHFSLTNTYCVSPSTSASISGDLEGLIGMVT